MPNPYTHPTYNDTCPFCQEKDLHATILETWSGVPLRADGWDTADANSNETEVDYVECHSCGEMDLINHYLHHDMFHPDGEYEHCDCIPAEEENDEHGEHSPETH